MYAYVVIVIVTHWLLAILNYFTIHPMHNCIRTLNLIFGLLAQVASRPSVQLNLSLFHCLIRTLYTYSVVQFVVL